MRLKMQKGEHWARRVTISLAVEEVWNPAFRHAINPHHMSNAITLSLAWLVTPRRSLDIFRSYPKLHNKD